ncbi:NAD(P)-binding domain-containing protein [Nocardia rhamnosiphila]|uniref:NAD(P)-binding domain-containing protein n=1 Tax=Nocardia rhamnosiphila TaxID=426716 RepID=A0ABV2WJJ0_9NOCA
MSRAASSVTVIGLGPMGQAMVERLRASGLVVTVWNRSQEKAIAMERFGAARAHTATQALDAGEVIVVGLTDYAAMYDVLEPAVDHLPGKTIVNLSSGSPEETRAAGSWVRARGGRFLAGGVMADREGVGGADAYIFYSGEREVFDACAEALRPLGRPEYLGGDEGIAQLTAGAGHVVETAGAVGVGTHLARAVHAHWLEALTESERTGVPISTFQLLRGDAA